MFVEVAFPLPLRQSFHYSLPASLASVKDLVGKRVMAPFGPKTLVGYIVATQTETPEFATKPIGSILDDDPLMDWGHLDLAKWIAQHYLCSLGEALATVLPSTLQAPKRKTPRSEEREEKRDSALLQPLSSLLTSRSSPLVLSVEQARILDQFVEAVDAKRFQPFLLRGITDSGKTELYLRTIDHAMKAGRQAIFLVPEIALTPPFIDLLKARYSDSRVGIWHSGLSAGQRYQTWTRARRGEIQVVLGARSAVFAPLPRLGVIVMDEEHEFTYKQEERPRYHTRDVALWRARQAKAVMIMGSATPSLESYTLAREGVYRLVELTSRVEEKELPQVTLIDRRSKKQRQDKEDEEIAKKGEPVPPRPASASKRTEGFAIFSEPLRLAIERRLARREQILLFVNRRGFNPFLRCSKCGWVARCERCSMTLAEHMIDDKRALQCHSCMKSYPPINQCPACKSMRLGHFGIGTQRVEEEIKRLYPFARMARLDKDVSQARHAYEKVYRAFQAKELDLLVGTQIIAKGFDFPGVTLVGVVDADVTLHLPDFRSAERTFQLITQVAGRTGRGERKGEVLVQTHHPDHYALEAAQEHDYVRFYEREIQDRKELNYPPCCRLIHVVLRATKEPLAAAAAEQLIESLEALNSGAEFLGPVPSPYSRLRNQFRYQVLIKGTDATLAPCLEYLRIFRAKKAFATVDIDPNDLL